MSWGYDLICDLVAVHRTVGRALCVHLLQPLLQRGRPEQGAQGQARVALEDLQEGDSTASVGQPVSLLVLVSQAGSAWLCSWGGLGCEMALMIHCLLVVPQPDPSRASQTPHRAQKLFELLSLIWALYFIIQITYLLTSHFSSLQAPQLHATSPPAQARYWRTLAFFIRTTSCLLAGMTFLH